MNRRSAAVKAKKANKSQRTKATGRARGKPAEFEEAISARVALRRNTPRKDSVPAMRRIYDKGWDYDEDKALASGLAEKGYYIEKTLSPLISPDDAYELFCYHNYDNQRRLDEAHARQLAACIGVAHDINFAVGPDGKALIVNGQHSFWAIYLRGQDTQAGIKIWMVRDEQAMADLYSIFDDLKKRTLNNSIHAAQGANSLTYQGKETRLAKWSQCAGVAENDFNRKCKEGRSIQLDRAKRADVQKFAVWMDGHVTDGFQMKLVPQGIGAAFFAMWQSDLVQAETFAKQYFTGEQLASGHPALFMRNKFANRPRGLHAASVCREHAEVMFTAWRKACLGETLYSMRRTLALPAANSWKIYKSAIQATR